MNIRIFKNRDDLGRKAASDAAGIIENAIRKNGSATIVLATGTSQFEVLKYLVEKPGVDWSKVVLYHLDEYIGIPMDHPASFRRYIQERVIDKVSPMKEVHLIRGQSRDPLKECQRLGKSISTATVDLVLAGIGENGHLAFNDPPADFITGEPFIVVTLDLKCRQQQLGEGWFKTLKEVPEKAITMSIRQIMKSRHIICVVPDKRKAEAVKNCMEKEVSNRYPASVLREHPGCTLYLDHDSASLLTLK
jgi:glucosamine-6-phosphate deaminase